jgi:hypothetical protein
MRHETNPKDSSSHAGGITGSRKPVIEATAGSPSKQWYLLLWGYRGISLYQRISRHEMANHFNAEKQSGRRVQLPEILLRNHADNGDVILTVFKKPGIKAIIIPGLSFGVIIWAAQFVSDQYLISTGFVGMRSTVFPIMAFMVTPLLLIITGIVSEIIRNREQNTGWTPWIPYKAGFLAMSLAFLLFRIVSSVNQYLPYMTPGFLPRLAYVTGNLIMYFPILLVISTLFACFSFAGGWGMHWILMRKGKRPD